MADTPPLTPHRRVLTDGAKDRITTLYAAVYSSCAGFGMSEIACARYARAAVDDLTEYVGDLSKGIEID